MYEVISSFDTEIKIKKEELVSVPYSSVVHNQKLELDNKKSRKSSPIIKVTFNTSVEDFKLKNNTTGVEVTCSKTNGFSETDQIVIEEGGTYYSGAELENYTYTGILEIKENCVNEFQVFLTPAVDTDVDIQFQWLMASGSAITKHYVRDFRVNEREEIAEIPPTFGSKEITDFKRIKTSYIFSMGSLWSDSYFFNLDKDTLYQIIYETDSDIEGIEQQTIYLCGCMFEDLERSERDGDFVMENISGKAISMLK